MSSPTSMTTNNPDETYYIHLGSDDLLGHRVRHLFRDIASSRNDTNGIYYYLAELVDKYGEIKSKLKEKVLNEGAFKKIFCQNPNICDKLFTEEEISILFYKFDRYEAGYITLDDLVSYCLLDKTQLATIMYKYWIKLVNMKLSEQDLRENFIRLTKINELHISPDLFNAMIYRDFDISLTTGETACIMRLIDLDKDDKILYNDFEAFVSMTEESINILIRNDNTALDDIKISKTEKESQELRLKGYSQLAQDIQHTNKESGNVYLWYKKNTDNLNGPYILDIVIAETSRDTELIAKGYFSLEQNIQTRSSGFMDSETKMKNLWICYTKYDSSKNLLSYSSCKRYENDQIVEIAVTIGEKNSKNISSLRMPPCRGFYRVKGNLHEKKGGSQKYSTFLWIRRASGKNLFSYKTDKELKQQVIHNTTADIAGLSTNTSSEGKIENKIKGHESIEKEFLKVHIIECNIRNILRQKCPIEPGGCISLKKLFDDFDVKHIGAVTQNKFMRGVERMGLKMDKKDFFDFWKKIASKGTTRLSYNEFILTLELTNTEIDAIIENLQRFMTNDRKKGKDYKEIFDNICRSTEKVLSPTDFVNILGRLQILVTKDELFKIFGQFDSNKDGIVDYVDFLKFITEIPDSIQRKARWISESATVLRNWTKRNQNVKLTKDGNIDSSPLWKLLKSKSLGEQFREIDSLLRENGFRLNLDELQRLFSLISPATNGKSFNHDSVHTFVNHKPKKIESMMSTVSKLVNNFEALQKSKDEAYDKLNVELNGTVPFPKLHDEIKKLSVELGMPFLELKDFIYLVQYTGADLPESGLIVLDRFLAVVRGVSDKRYMKNEFAVPHDSKSFHDGIKALRKEISVSARTPDNKIDYQIPFRLFDKNENGSISLAEFERAVRDLGIGEFLSNDEIKTMMRRFDVDSSGGITFDEFVRFAEDQTNNEEYNDNNNTEEHKNANFKNTVKRFATKYTLNNGQLEKDFRKKDGNNKGFLTAGKFLRILKKHEVEINDKDLKEIFEFLNDGRDQIDYVKFLEIATECQSHQHPEDSKVNLLVDQASEEVLGKLICSIHALFNDCDGSSLLRTFEIVDKNQKRVITIEEFEDVLKLAGMVYSLNKDEKEALLKLCGDISFPEKLNYCTFCDYIKKTLNKDSMRNTIEEINPETSIREIFEKMKIALSLKFAEEKPEKTLRKLFKSKWSEYDALLTWEQFYAGISSFNLSLEEADCKRIFDFYAKGTNDRITVREMEDLICSKLVVTPQKSPLLNFNRNIAHDIRQDSKSINREGTKDILDDRHLKKSSISSRPPSVKETYCDNKEHKFIESNNNNIIKEHNGDTFSLETFYVSSDEEEDYGSDWSYPREVLQLIYSRTIYTRLELDKLRSKVKRSRLLERTSFREFRYYLKGILGLDIKREEMDILCRFLCKKISYTRNPQIVTNEQLIDFEKFKFLVKTTAYEPKEQDIQPAKKNEETHISKHENDKLGLSGNASSVMDIKFLKNLYESLTTAAKSGFSISKMLERIDKKRTGKVSISDFTLILKLLRCNITEKDVRTICFISSLCDNNSEDEHTLEISYRSVLSLLPILFDEPSAGHQYLKERPSSPVMNAYTRQYMSNQTDFNRKIDNPTRLPSSPMRKRQAQKIQKQHSVMGSLQCLVYNKGLSKKAFLESIARYDPNRVGLVRSEDVSKELTKYGIKISHEILENEFPTLCSGRYHVLMEYEALGDILFANALDYNPEERQSIIKTISCKVYKHAQNLWSRSIHPAAAFEAMDVLRNGKLTRSEFITALRRTEFPLEKFEIEFILDELCDTATPDLISYKRFMRICDSNGSFKSSTMSSSYPKSPTPHPLKIHSPHQYIPLYRQYPNTTNQDNTTNHNNNPNVVSQGTKSNIQSECWACEMCFNVQDISQSICEICGYTNPKKIIVNSRIIPTS